MFLAEQRRYSAASTRLFSGVTLGLGLDIIPNLDVPIDSESSPLNLRKATSELDESRSLCDFFSFVANSLDAGPGLV